MKRKEFQANKMLRENKFGFIKFYTEKDNKHFGFITE